MDDLRDDAAFVQSVVAAATGPPNPAVIDFQQQHPISVMPTTRTQPESSQRADVDCAAARKLQKADREKLRRDRLNEQFLELGNALDPDRPKNDKGTILSDAIQLLNDLTSKVNKLKAEHALLSDESRELTVEKNYLRDEKESLKSYIDSLNTQNQQSLRSFFPWASADQSTVVAPCVYPFPVPVAMSPPGSIPIHPSMRPYPFVQSPFMNQNPGVVHNPCSTFVPYMAPNVLVEQHSSQDMSPLAQLGGRSDASCKQDSQNKPSGDSKTENGGDSNDVTTELELKTPGSSTEQNLSSGTRKSEESMGKENVVVEDSSSSKCSPSRSTQDSSSNSVVARKADASKEGKD